MKARYNKSEIMKRAHELKIMMGYDTFSQALKHSWSVAKNEVREREQDAKNEVVYAQWRAEAEAKRKAEIEAEKARFEASGMDLHTYTMTNFYNGYGYKGD